MGDSGTGPDPALLRTLCNVADLTTAEEDAVMARASEVSCKFREKNLVVQLIYIYGCYFILT